MAKHHLQLHGQPLGNHEESNNSWVGGGGDESGWPELKKSITQENDQGKELSSQLIQHSKLQTKLMAGLCWVGGKPFQQCHNFIFPPHSCNVKSDVFLAIQVSFQVDSEISLAGNEPLNRRKVTFERCKP